MENITSAVQETGRLLKKNAAQSVKRIYHKNDRILHHKITIKMTEFTTIKLP